MPTVLDLYKAAAIQGLLAAMKTPPKTEAAYKGVEASLAVDTTSVMICSIESSNPGKGEAQEMIKQLQKDHPGKVVQGYPLNETHLYQAGCSSSARGAMNDLHRQLHLSKYTECTCAKPGKVTVNGKVVTFEGTGCVTQGGARIHSCANCGHVLFASERSAKELKRGERYDD